jgi:hypothetical protein
MNLVALILWCAAAVLFAAATLAPPYSARLVYAGLALLTVGLIVQSGSTTHDVTF